MAGEVAVRPDNRVRPWLDMDERAKAVLKTTIAKDCNPAEFEVFLRFCVHRNLDPFSGHVFPTVYNKNSPDRKLVMVVSLDAKRTMAENTGEVEGRSEGEIFYEKKDGNKVRVNHSDFDPEDCKRIISGTIEVYRKDRKPERRTAIFSQYDKSKQEKGGDVWRKFPSHMILKCAESHGTTAAFPLETAGMYIPEELDTNGPIDVTATVVSEKTEPAKPEPKAALPSPEKPPIEQPAQKPEPLPVKSRSRQRREAIQKGQPAPASDDPRPPTKEPAPEPQQTPMGLSTEQTRPQTPPKTAKEVWESFKQYCHDLKGSEVAARAFTEAFASVRKRFTLGPDDSIEAIPDDLARDLRMFLNNTVLKELQQENWLPMERQE